MAVRLHAAAFQLVGELVDIVKASVSTSIQTGFGIVNRMSAARAAGDNVTLPTTRKLSNVVGAARQRVAVNKISRTVVNRVGARHSPQKSFGSVASGCYSTDISFARSIGFDSTAGQRELMSRRASGSAPVVTATVGRPCWRTRGQSSSAVAVRQHQVEDHVRRRTARAAASAMVDATVTSVSALPGGEQPQGRRCTRRPRPAAAGPRGGVRRAFRRRAGMDQVIATSSLSTRSAPRWSASLCAHSRPRTALLGGLSALARTLALSLLKDVELIDVRFERVVFHLGLPALPAAGVVVRGCLLSYCEREMTHEPRTGKFEPGFLRGPRTGLQTSRLFPVPGAKL